MAGFRNKYMYSCTNEKQIKQKQTRCLNDSIRVYSASSLTHQSARRHITSRGHITM